MADYAFGGSDEENVELKKLYAEVLDDQDSFDAWEKLIRACEALEGGLNRNSNPSAIAATRDFYDRFLGKFPLLFGYWKKYADLEFAIAGTEAADLVYERGIASITNSVDLWTNYCSFKVETSHDTDIIRELFERGASSVGLDFLAHPFWDKYIEFEERLEATERVFALLDRIIRIPMHQYARYFERFRQLAQSRPLSDLASATELTQYRAELASQGNLAEPELERETRTRIDNSHLELFRRTQDETTRRWVFESEIKRPYFHVTELDESQLSNWRKYLDFEEAEGNFARTVFLYERCLVTCAFYEDFWLRYSRWMAAQDEKEQELRFIYQRASCIYVPIACPTIRLQYAYFEESCGRVGLAQDIHRAVLAVMPGHVDTIISLANLSRRHGGLEAAIAVYKEQLDSSECSLAVKAALVAEWARLLWTIKGSVDEARQVFAQSQQYYLDSPRFWESYLRFELEQPTSAATEKTQYGRIKQVYEAIGGQSQLPATAIASLSQTYLRYLLERGDGSAASEYRTVDRLVYGPASVQSGSKTSVST